MRSVYDLEAAIRGKGKWIKSKALAVAALLGEYGADPTRLVEAQFDYGGRAVCIPAELADHLMALLMYLGPGPRGRPPKDSTRFARHLARSGMSQRKAAQTVAEMTEDEPEAIRGRLVIRKKGRLRKSRSRKPPSPKAPNKPRR